jgi:hypothetical protein
MSDVLKRRASVVKALAHKEGDGVIRLSNVLCADEINRWLRVGVYPDRISIVLDPPLDLGFQFLEVLTCPPEL